ncbi:MAG: hypothetical protein K0Q83_1254 [Deltaproteobacteria bacterium]|nr:hypothetical protein [Deltaproteobacteria bacterium]
MTVAPRYNMLRNNPFDTLFSLHLSNANIRFQSFFMSITVQPFALASSRALSSLPMDDVRA